MISKLYTPFLFVVLYLLTSIGYGQNVRYNGTCSNSGLVVTTSGVSSTTKVDRTVPSCLVTIFNQGTLVPSTIFSDVGGTPLANPFTANSNGTYSFYINGGTRVDIQHTGGTSPNNYSSAFTLFDQTIGSSAGTAPPFIDTQTIVKGSVDLTKLLRFEVDGFTTGVTRVITPPNSDITLAGIDISNLWSDGVRQTFNPSNSATGLNPGSNATDPTVPNNGDVYYNTTANKLRCYENGAWVNCVAPTGSGAPGGVSGQLQYNNAGAFGGIANVSTTGTSITFGLGALIAPNITNTGTLTLPGGSDTLVARTTVDTFTNKTIASPLNTLGGVTISIGSDAQGDIYYRGPTGLLTRLGIGSSAQVLTVTGGLPVWSSTSVGANAALSNLASVSINTSLLAQTNVDLGSTTNPFRNLVFWGSGTFGTTSITLTSTPTTHRTWTFQNTTDTVVGRNTTDTLTLKTLTAPVITSPQISPTIFDSNGNELFNLTATGSAVNELTFANASTGNNPTWTASGGDSNIGINWLTKGSGTFNFTGNSTQAAQLRLFEDTDDGVNYTSFHSVPMSANVNYSLPPDDGTTGQFLTTDGSGVLTWTTSAGGGMSIGGAVTSGTTGSVLFVGAGPVLAQDNANFFWDDTNNRLGLGTTSPDAPLSFPSSSGNRINFWDGLNVGIHMPSGAQLDYFVNSSGDEINFGYGTPGSITKVITVINDRLGIGTTSPQGPIGFPTTNGEKIKLYAQFFGIAVSGGTDVQIYVNNSSGEKVALGHGGATGSFVEDFSVAGTGSAFTLLTANTNTVANIINVTANSSGTAATGFGLSETYSLESSTTNGRTAGRIDVTWTDATDATRTSAIVFNTVASAAAAAEHFRVSSTGVSISGGANITKVLTGTASLDFANALAAQTCDVLTITVTGAADGDIVTLGIPTALAANDLNTTFHGWVSSANTVSVKRCNIGSAATTDPAAATVRATVIQH